MSTKSCVHVTSKIEPMPVFLDDIYDHGMIVPQRMAERLRLPIAQLARLAHVNRGTMVTKPESPAVQIKLGEIVRIIAGAAELTGDEGKAIIWFRHQPIPGFGKTAEELVEEDKAALVIEDFKRMAAGVYS